MRYVLLLLALIGASSVNHATSHAQRGRVILPDDGGSPPPPPPPK